MAADTLPQRVVVSLSGGMDSTSLLVKLLADGIKVHGVSFDYGQKHRLELERLQANLDYLSENGFQIDWRLVDISSLQGMLHSSLTSVEWDVPTGHYESANMRETVVPNRNAIFASIAYAWALSLAQQHGEPVLLSLGVHSGDHAIYPDCRPEFYEQIMSAFQSGNWDSHLVQLHLPWLSSDKATILRDAATAIEKLGLDFNTVFRNTCTSYSPDNSGRSHGTTGSDVERILAFHEIGRRDPTHYIDDWEVCVQRALQLKKQFDSATREN
jgi:7-cyano-7-deazaguanine synthase